MARTPSMTKDEAEALLGARGSLIVDASNKGTARKWYTAQGLPGLFVAGLAMRALAAGYNDTSGATLAKFREQANDAKAEDDAAAPAIDMDQLERDIADIAPAKHNGAANGHANGNGSMTQLRELILGDWQPQATLSRDEIRSVVAEVVAERIPHVIEIRNGERHVQIEGRTHPCFERVLKLISNGANVLLVGPAGCGKSHLAEQLAKALAVRFGMISGSAGASEGELKGWLLPVAGGAFEYSASEFVECYEGGDSLYCWDELDGFDPNMMLVANSALANGHINIPIRRHQPRVTRGQNVFLMATANTYGTGANPIYCGRNPLDEATRDRFVIVTMDYDTALESDIGAAAGLSAAQMSEIWALRDKTREAQLRRVISTRAFQKAAAMVRAGDSWPTIMNTLVEGWSKDELAKVGR